MTEKEIKQVYISIADKLLGLGADANENNMTDEAINVINEFLIAVSECSRIPNGILQAFRDLIGLLIKNKPIKDLYTALSMISDIEKSIKNQQSIFIGCYFAAKNKYAQELQRVFFFQ